MWLKLRVQCRKGSGITRVVRALTKDLEVKRLFKFI